MNFSEAIELNLQDSKFEKTYEKKKKLIKKMAFSNSELLIKF